MSMTTTPDQSAIPAQFRGSSVMPIAQASSQLSRMCARWAMGLVEDQALVEALAYVGEKVLDFSNTVAFAHHWWLENADKVGVSATAPTLSSTPENLEHMSTEIEEYLRTVQAAKNANPGTTPPSPPAGDPTVSGDLHTDDAPTEME